ncbi:TetR/AcrR family transcriptional regulator [Oceanicoccus sp. KOV_DT_Chl]|uniref:TetR/AcrR family transcriptional regulator n=1 Tax=Oceanicoccus sp. KOV_DT_Chl TaxID=1904639 RepID=UPI000C79EC72|nr:TetR/AcrR family transcriptional regulator [Oceanicoccus sp. KOV_DT_Chl]
MKSTAEKILDAAEDLFAEKGYDATSLGDVADVVGIRSPSLYNHFRNKEALYTSVVERLISRFYFPLVEMLEGDDVSQSSVLKWLEKVVNLHHDNPNFARLIQHAALSGGPHTKELVERMVKPMFDRRGEEAQKKLFGLGNPELQPFAIIALNNIMMSYLTMAPLYKDMLDQDPYSDEARLLQTEMILKLAEFVMGPAERS